MSVRDGSGLSRLDRVSAGGLCRLFVEMGRHPHAAAFFDSLPQAGVDGTLKRRGGKLDLRAKTGSLDICKSLSGYLTASSGERFAVSLVYNDPRGTGDGVGKIDRMLEAIAASL